MELEIKNGKEFVNAFIGGLSKISETGIIKYVKDRFTCLTSTADNTIIIYSEYRYNLDNIEDLTLNVPDFKKLHKLLSILPDAFTLKISANSISHSSSDISFKYHLFEDGIISSPALNVVKIDQITADCECSIKIESVKDLMKTSFLLPDITKVYFNFVDGKVYGEITDKSRHNVDSFTKLLCDEVKGESFTRTVPINIEILKLLSSTSSDNVKVRYSKNYSVFIFDISGENLCTRYVVSGLVS